MAQFDDLPLEVRDMLYENLLQRRYSSSKRRSENELALFTVSKEVHQQASSYFYKNNHITVDIPSACTRTATILPPIGDRYLKLIRRLTLDAWVGQPSCAGTQQVAKAISNLAATETEIRELTICLRSPLSHLLNSRVDDSVFGSDHPITEAFKTLLKSQPAIAVRIDLKNTWFVPGVITELQGFSGSRIEIMSNGAATTDMSVLERHLFGRFTTTQLPFLELGDLTSITGSEICTSSSVGSANLSSMRSAFSELDVFDTSSYATSYSCPKAPCSTSACPFEEQLPDFSDDEDPFALHQDTDGEYDDDLAGIEVNMDLDLEPVPATDVEQIMCNVANNNANLANEQDMVYLANFIPDLL